MSKEARQQRRDAAHLSALPPVPSMFDPVKQQVLRSLAGDFSSVIVESAGSGPNDYMMDNSGGQRQTFRWVHVTLMIRENIGHPQQVEPPAGEQEEQPAEA